MSLHAASREKIIMEKWKNWGAMSFLENGKKLSFFMINEDIREWGFLKIFFPSLPNFFKHKRSLHLLGGLLDNCQTSEFMALQVSEKQEHDCLPQICTILMYFSSSHLIAVRSDAWGKAAWPQSLEGGASWTWKSKSWASRHPGPG